METPREDGSVSKAVKIFKVKARQKRSRQDWPAHTPAYCRFLLYKENRDTAEAVSILAKLLRVKTKQFSFAGNKDRRGITVQRVTVWRVTADKLAALNHRLYGMQLGNYEYVLGSNLLVGSELIGALVAMSVILLSLEIWEAINSVSVFVKYRPV